VPASERCAEYLVANGALTAEPQSATPAERRWEALNLHDALVFHRATRGVMWRHEYPEQARVMTWDNYDKPIEAAEPRPPVEYPDGPNAVRLPEPSPQSLQTDGYEALAKRRTQRSFRNTVISLQQTADLLHWSLRPIIEGAGRRYFSTLSCADGYRETIEPHPIGAHLFFNQRKLPPELADRAERLFRYNPRTHSLVPSPVNPGEYYKFSRLLWDQDFADEAPLMVILGVNWDQFMWKYRVSHAYRLVHFDLGAYMQTALVTAAALHLRTFMTPAVDDARVARLLGTNEGVYAPCYTLAVGEPVGTD
jgi:SagB-type dehydrogenase family enzyme